jgi:hypothetical protein
MAMQLSLTLDFQLFVINSNHIYFKNVALQDSLPRKFYKNHLLLHQKSIFFHLV